MTCRFWAVFGGIIFGGAGKKSGRTKGKGFDAKGAKLATFRHVRTGYLPGRATADSRRE